jgi:hypothetical protein
LHVPVSWSDRSRIRVPGDVVLTIEDGGSWTINGDLRIWDEIIVNGAFDNLMVTFP